MCVCGERFVAMLLGPSQRYVGRRGGGKTRDETRSTVKKSTVRATGSRAGKKKIRHLTNLAWLQ